MKIANVKVQGYRLLDNFELDLCDELSLVIGKNNTGKTSLLNLLSAYLSGTKPRFAYEDFSIPIQQRLLDAVCARQACSMGAPARISLELEIQYDEADNLRNLSHLMVDLAPDARSVHLRFTSEITETNFMRLYEEANKSVDAVEAAVRDQLGETERREEIRRFLSKNLSSYLITTIASFDPKDESVTLDLSKEKELVRQVLRLEYVSARRSVENRQSGGRTKVAGRALSRLSGDYFDDHTGGREDNSAFIKLAAEAAKTDRNFTETYASVFEDVVKKIKQFGAGAGFSGDIRIISNIEPTSLLQDSTSVMYGHEESLLPEDHNGLGYLNLIAIIMEIEIRILRMNNHSQGGPSDINLLAIEEPEAHTHPQLQYIFIKQIKKLLSSHRSKSALQLQTIITTHSSHITAESDFSDIKYFRRSGEQVVARNMTDLEKKYGQDSKEYHFLTQYLTLTRAELFFADKAVLIEGDTERILLRAMMHKIDLASPEHDNPLGSQNISIVEVGAHSHIFEHFIEFTGIKTLVITDLDSGKVHKDAKGKKVKGCPVDEGTHTMNHSLLHFFQLSQSTSPDKGVLEELRNRPVEEKMLAKTPEGWKNCSSDPLMFVAYQTEEDRYNARSYEDAFIHLNRPFITKHAEKFMGLKNRQYFSDADKTAFDLAEKCVAKKTHFALDLIFLDDAESDESWVIPSYINEGLCWLRDA